MQKILERTFIMVKPDGVQRCLTGKIIQRFEDRGFKLVAMKFLMPSQELLEEHYAEHSKKKFFKGLIESMMKAPCAPMVWEGQNIVKIARKMMGETKPADSLPGTIRGDFCIDIGRNIIHGSDSVETAKKEIQLWFQEHEITSWNMDAYKWIYE